MIFLVKILRAGEDERRNDQNEVLGKFAVFVRETVAIYGDSGTPCLSAKLLSQRGIFFVISKERMWGVTPLYGFIEKKRFALKSSTQ